MRPVVVTGATHELKPPTNWDPETDGECGSLWCRVGILGERKLRTFTSAWKPSAEELAILSAGGAIEIEIVGTQPPMAVQAVQHTPPVERAHVTINEDGHGLGYDEHGPATP